MKKHFYLESFGELLEQLRKHGWSKHQMPTIEHRIMLCNVFFHRETHKAKFVSIGMVQEAKSILEAEEAADAAEREAKKQEQ